ncbi:G-protein coupled receptor 64-like, partial [Scleropages formosus]
EINNQSTPHRPSVAHQNAQGGAQLLVLGPPKDYVSSTSLDWGGLMRNLTSLYDQMGNGTTMAVSAGEIKGLMIKTENLTTDADFAIDDSGINDAKNSTVLNDKVIGIDMGAEISGLKTTINISFNNIVNVSAKLSCQSWNGRDPLTWTPSGCDTVQQNTTVTCQCNHLTFFAVLMVPDVTISASDFTSLTYITYIGCGLSTFFLCIVLFTHFVLSQSTKILINLFVAMFLLNMTFLSNEWVSSLDNVAGCKVMAAVMHYSMLATFSWFAVEAFHLCFQLSKGSSSNGDHYVLKLCLTGWVLPALVVVVLLALGKYNQYSIDFNDGRNAKMCWITDSLVQYVVNIGYYSLVFLFTFTVFIIIIRRLIYIRSQKSNSGKGSGKGDIFTIMGVCCLLGISWGFAFLSYGPLRLPGLYIFTILNSFQ